MISAGVDWIAFSMDGATAEIYEEIRKGSNFERVCENLANIAALRVGKVPKTMINFLLMQMNFHQVEEMVRLAAQMGVDQVNFKQCDVIRDEHGKGYGLFASKETRQVRRLEKSLSMENRALQVLQGTVSASSLCSRNRKCRKFFRSLMEPNTRKPCRQPKKLCPKRRKGVTYATTFSTFEHPLLISNPWSPITIRNRNDMD
jgi:MoaA/NifB/PqqE/SkfB family radical SAM enzyme